MTKQDKKTKPKPKTPKKEKKTKEPEVKISPILKSIISDDEIPEQRQVPEIIKRIPSKEEYGYYEIRVPIGFALFTDKKAATKIISSIEGVAAICRTLDKSKAPIRTSSTISHTERAEATEPKRSLENMISDLPEHIEKQLEMATSYSDEEKYVLVEMLLSDEGASRIQDKRIEIGGLDLDNNPLTEVAAAMILYREDGGGKAKPYVATAGDVSKLDLAGCPTLDFMTYYENDGQYGISYNIYCGDDPKSVLDWLKGFDTSIRKRKNMKYPVLANNGKSIMFCNPTEFAIFERIANERGIDLNKGT